MTEPGWYPLHDGVRVGSPFAGAVIRVSLGPPITGSTSGGRVVLEVRRLTTGTASIDDFPPAAARVLALLLTRAADQLDPPQDRPPPTHSAAPEQDADPVAAEADGEGEDEDALEAAFSDALLDALDARIDARAAVVAKAWVDGYAQRHAAALKAPTPAVFDEAWRRRIREAFRDAATRDAAARDAVLRVPVAS